MLAVALAGCGDNASPSIARDPSVNEVIGTSRLRVSGEQAGSGSSAQQPGIEAWAGGYSIYQPAASVAYDPQGSGAGVTSFLQGAVSWAGTDVPLTPTQRSRSQAVCGGRRAIDLPVFVSPVAFVYNIPRLGKAHIRFSAGLLADLLAGRVGWWDDARLLAQNPTLRGRIPHLRVTPVWRSDQSGTTQIVSAYLAAAAPGKWPAGAGKTWPYAAGQGAKGTAGVSSTVSQAQGTIGYVDLSQVGSLGTIALLQGGRPVLPTAHGASAFVTAAADKLAGSASSDADLTLSPDYASRSSAVYPVTQMSYLITCPAFSSKATRQFVGSWVYYIASAQAQDLSAQVAGSVPLPRSLARRIQAVGRSIMDGAEQTSTGEGQ